MLQVDELGGAVACTASNCSFSGCTLSNNTAKLGGAVWSSSAKLLALEDAQIVDNKVNKGRCWIESQCVCRQIGRVCRWAV
jgi:hypothetical protein